MGTITIPVLKSSAKIIMNHAADMKSSNGGRETISRDGGGSAHAQQ